MNSLQKILKVDSIQKQFGNVTAVNNISFEINRGEIFALLGPNGAGKTTIVRMLMNIIQPDFGKISYQLESKNNTGIPESSELGYLPEERGLYQEIPLIKTLIFMGIIRGMDKNSAEKSAIDWLEKLQLSERKSEKLNALSKGNQQKVQFISSIIHNPSFLILDEPFSGFDPINQELFSSIITELALSGTTILLSAHQMQLVERIADKVLLINKGKSIAAGTVNEIKKGYNAEETLIIKVEGSPDLSIIQSNDAVEKAELLSDSEIKIFLKRDRSLSELLNKISAKYGIASVKSEHVTLHDIFIDMVKNDL